MRINIVTVSSGWILQKISERIHKELKHIVDSSLSRAPDLKADANFYVDIQNCYHQKTNTIDIGYFTHLHENSVRFLRPHWTTLDYIFHHGYRYYNIFKDFYPAEKMAVVLPGEIPEGFSLKKPTIGIFQRGEFEGKGYNFMQRMAEFDVMTDFKFLFVGKGWESVEQLYTFSGIEVKHVVDEDYSKYPIFYDTIDFLLVPSLWEGGPMAIIEAYAKGIPIISSNVGWVGTDIRVDYMFQPNNPDQLLSILHEIKRPLEERRKRVASLSYKNYAEKLVSTVKSLKDKR